MYVCLFSVLLLVNLALGAKLPGQFVRCKKDKDFDACLPGAIQKAVVFIKDGLPELGVNKLEPISVPKVSIGAGSGAVHLVQNYEDAELVGVSSLTVTKAHFDFEKKILTFTSTFPQLDFRGQYNINGKVLVLPVYGKGASSLKIDDVTLESTIQFEEVTKKENTFYNVKDFKITLAIKHAKYDFQNLFDGNKELGDNILTVINDNWEEIFLDVREGYENTFAAIFKSFAERIFNRIPINQIFD